MVSAAAVVEEAAAHILEVGIGSAVEVLGDTAGLPAAAADIQCHKQHNAEDCMPASVAVMVVIGTMVEAADHTAIRRYNHSIGPQDVHTAVAAELVCLEIVASQPKLPLLLLAQVVECHFLAALTGLVMGDRSGMRLLRHPRTVVTVGYSDLVSDLGVLDCKTTFGLVEGGLSQVSRAEVELAGAYLEVEGFC